MKPLDIVRLSGKIDKRALALDLIRNAEMTLVDQILAPMWKNLDPDYVRSFMVDLTVVRFVCHNRACPVDKTVDIAKGTTLGEAKENFKMGFFSVGGSPLAPFVNGRRVDDDYTLRGGELVEYKLP